MSLVTYDMPTNKILFLQSKKVEKKLKKTSIVPLKNGAVGIGKRRRNASLKSWEDVSVERTRQWLNSKRASMEKVIWRYVINIFITLSPIEKYTG